MSCFKGNFWSLMVNIVSSGSLDVEMYFGCIVKSIIYIAVSSMAISVRLVFLVADCKVTDYKRNHKQRSHYFSGLNLFFGKFWIFCLLFLFFLLLFGGCYYLISCCNTFLCYCKHLRSLRGRGVKSENITHRLVQSLKNRPK